MLKNNLNIKVDYKFSQYYLNCDFINKYNVKSLYKKPILKQLVVELPLEQIIAALIIKSQHSNENIQIISFFFLYIVSNLLPFINFNKLNLLKLVNSNNYSLKIIYNTEQQIYSFLHDICEKFKIENCKAFQNNEINFKNFFILTQTCKSDTFFELQSITDKYIKNINIKELDFYIRFCFFNTSTIKSNEKLTYNFPFLNK